MLLLLLAIFVMNVKVEVLSAGSVRVSWDSVEIPQPSLYMLQAYVVNYTLIGTGSRAFMMTVPISITSALIEGLAYNMPYQFQVLVSVDIKGEVFLVPDVSTVARIVVRTQAAPATTATVNVIVASTPPIASSSSGDDTMTIAVLGALNGFVILAAIGSVALIFFQRFRRCVNYTVECIVSRVWRLMSDFLAAL
jgi:hypothetical protein